MGDQVQGFGSGKRATREPVNEKTLCCDPCAVIPVDPDVALIERIHLWVSDITGMEK